jgi:NlpC/P60 family putative phage cell wall peptidase
MNLQERIVAAARTWIGTPFEHQGRLKGAGVDCAGLVVGVARELGLPHADVDGYGRNPRRALLEAELAAQMDPIALAELRPGDVLLFRIEREPQHLGIVSSIEPLAVVHAFSGAGLMRCVEHSLDYRWQRRIIGAYRYRQPMTSDWLAAEVAP